MNGKDFTCKRVGRVKCSCKAEELQIKTVAGLLVTLMISIIDAMLFIRFKSERSRMQKIWSREVIFEGREFKIKLIVTY